VKDGSGNTITTWASIAVNPANTRQYILTIDSNQYSYFATATSETLTIETTLADWPANAGNTGTTFGVSFTPLGCDCSYLQWTAPSVGTDAVNIAASITPTLNAPVSDSSDRSVLAFSNCYENSGSCPTTGNYAAATDFQYRILGGSYAAISATGGWISFAGSTLTVAPTDPAVVGTYEIAATYTPDSGTASQFAILTITVRCEITSFAVPAAPTTGLTYNIWDDASFFDFFDGYVQDPACGYAYAQTFTFTGTNSYIKIDSANPGRLNV
jgi:hypothetical protein